MSADENTDSATCRLEEGLLNVLENFTVSDLIRISKMDNYFKDLITNHIIGKKLLNLRKLSQANKKEMLEMFGKSMAKFAIDEINLNNFLDTVMKYCSPRRLAEVELNLKESVTVYLDNIEQSTPFFTNLYKLKLNVADCHMQHSFDEFLKQLLEAATNLYSLQLTQVDMDGEWFKTKQLKNLRQFRLIKPRHLCRIKLTAFVCSLPNLETFSFKGDKDIMSIGSVLAIFCPKIKHFENIHTSIPDNDHSVGLHRYRFLSSFSQLKYITLTSYTFCGSDLFHPLVELAPRNIKKLRIFMDLECAVAYTGADREDIMRTSFADFRSLRELQLCVRNPTATADLQCDFIIHFATQLRKLDTFTLKSARLTDNSNKIIQMLRSVTHIYKLSISGVPFQNLRAEMRKIVRTLRTIRRAVDPYHQRMLQLEVNMEQWIELQRYEDFNNLINIILDPLS